MSAYPEFTAYSSARHRVAAIEFLDRASELEQEFVESSPIDILSPPMTRYHAYATGAITSTWAYLEATINEFWWTVAHPRNRHVYVRSPSSRSLRSDPGLTEREAEILAAVSPYVFAARKGLTWKYEQAQIAIGRTESSDIERSKAGVMRLVKFRNAYLIHSRPIESFAMQTNDVEKTLGSYFTSEMANPLASDDAPFFPARCLTESLGRKFLEDGENYVRSFFHTMGLGDYHHLGHLGIRTKVAEFRPASES